MCGDCGYSVLLGGSRLYARVGVADGATLHSTVAICGRPACLSAAFVALVHFASERFLLIASWAALTRPMGQRDAVPYWECKAKEKIRLDLRRPNHGGLALIWGLDLRLSGFAVPYSVEGNRYGP